MSSFSDPDAVSKYVARTERIVPGLRHLHQMTGLLLAERAPVDARILVLGAGGGMELKVLAEMHPDWRFSGVDPSAEMLHLATVNLGALASRAEFHEGYIDSAPEGPFDAAACLLTLHFLPEQERLQTLREVWRRLKPGAPFVVAHHSFPNKDRELDRWLARYAAFGAMSGVPDAQSENSIKAMKERLPVLSPEQDEALLREAGFSNIELFYAALTFKGWVGYKPT
ncbi:class I SAM-dependent methyltransferase [Phyllobacterium sp. YR531]|uniref:class I SAM-dependent methyltransferase n=1 Tax=Phyllobacterium sp. YR531 TaxID=1144343 RepID=UPI00026F757B|nr:class I SAM-dependent methyltransferase [Phyllobacterium sp. YR531]EJN02644.1 methylase involved in ubiquinone/menaquinone biosynthesis [Phyllobacterium sp. YR531]